ncbi:AAA family ATPase [Candidatus Manganitrophus noduliformans]|uniref:AAA family ATPase n=1 Tax=Candidatus Manganitrophus noduliformans TaxID=2606439 RepID=UPI001439008D|nr:AAA family ATPase [Candidatus Manganitrophus noduliformans]
MIQYPFFQHPARTRVRTKKLAAVTKASELTPKPEVEGISQHLKELISAIDQRISQLEKTLDPEQRKANERELQELEDRNWLSTILPEVEEEISRLKIIAAFDMAIQDTDTNRITRKATEVSRSLVTDKIRDAFAAEVAALGIADRRIELVQEPSGYGSTKFRVSLIRSPSSKVAQVLSEGEHRCVALAAFLAELSTANNPSGVIFDDPVSSLDHNHRGVLATRLVREAASQRQVIVFTHDIPFLMLLDDEARRVGLDPNYQSVNRADDRSGICSQGTPLKAQSIPEILDKIEKRLSSTKELYHSGRKDEWCEQFKAMAGRLRDAWELAVENVVAPVFRRFTHKVHISGLRQLIVITEQDFINMKEGYDICCTYCHTDPAELNRPIPTPDQIDLELKRLRLWFDSVRTRQDQKR